MNYGSGCIIDGGSIKICFLAWEQICLACVPCWGDHGEGAGTAGVVCACPALGAWAFPRVSCGMQGWFVPHLSSFCLWQELAVAVISYSDKASPALEYHLSAIGFCLCLSQCCCLAQVSLPDGVQRDAVHVPPHSSPLGGFCFFISAKLPLWGSSPGSPQYRVSHEQIAHGEARPSSQAPFLQRSVPVANLPFTHCSEWGLHGCCEGCQASSVTVSISLAPPTVHTCPVCCSLLAAPFGLGPEQLCPGCLRSSACLPRRQPLAPCAWWLELEAWLIERQLGRMASPPGQLGSPRHSCCLRCQGCWLWGLVAQCPP